MVRVAQMVLAHSIRRHFVSSNRQVDIKYVITPFLDEEGPEFKYSLNRFVEEAQREWGVAPGQWLSMTQATLLI